VEIQELARKLAEEMGRTPPEGLPRSVARAAYLARMDEEGIKTDWPTLYRLEDMIDNLCAEAWGDWDRKHGQAVPPHALREYNKYENVCRFPGCTLEESGHPDHLDRKMA